MIALTYMFIVVLPLCRSIFGAPLPGPITPDVTRRAHNRDDFGGSEGIAALNFGSMVDWESVEDSAAKHP